MGQNSQFVEILGTRLHFTVKGQGRPIVCLHGNPGFHGDWDIDEVPGYALYALDRPGHGLSARHEDERRGPIEAQIEMVRAFNEHVGWSREHGDRQVVLAGHSWGAYLALAYALKYQGDLRSLVLVGPLAYPRSDRAPKSTLTKILRQPMVGDALAALLAQSLGKKAILNVLRDGFDPRPIPDDYLRSVEPYFYRADTFRYMLEDKLALEASIGLRSEQYQNIALPTLIVAGEQDKIAPAESQAARLAKAIPGSKLVTIEGAPHELPQTKRDLLAALSGEIESKERS